MQNAGEQGGGAAPPRSQGKSNQLSFSRDRLLLRPREPFNFASTLRFILSPPALLNGRQFAPLLDYFVDGEYRRVLEFGEQLVLYGVREERDRSSAALRMRILAGPFLLLLLAARISFLLSDLLHQISAALPCPL